MKTKILEFFVQNREYWQYKRHKNNKCNKYTDHAHRLNLRNLNLPITTWYDITEFDYLSDCLYG